MDYAFKDFIDLYKTLNSSEWVTVFEENPTQNYENDVFRLCLIDVYFSMFLKGKSNPLTLVNHQQLP